MKTSTKTIPQEPANASPEQAPHVVDHTARLAELGAKQAELRDFLQKAESDKVDALIDGASDAQVETINQAISRAKQRVEAIHLQLADAQKQIAVAELAKKGAIFTAVWPPYAEKMAKVLSTMKTLDTLRRELLDTQYEMIESLGFGALDCCSPMNEDFPVNQQTIGEFERVMQIALSKGKSLLGKEWPY